MELSELIIKLRNIIERLIAETPYEEIKRIKEKYNKSNDKGSDK